MSGTPTVKQLVQQLDEIYYGNNWLDESYTEKLSALSESQAFIPPIDGVHSVAEIVWHCIYWRQTLIKRLEGDQGFRDRTVDEFNFLSLEKVKEIGWDILKQQLAQSQQDMTRLLLTRADEFLQETYDGQHTYQHIINGIIEHDAYHLGQIGLIIKMLTLAKKIN